MAGHAHGMKRVRGSHTMCVGRSFCFDQSNWKVRPTFTLYMGGNIFPCRSKLLLRPVELESSTYIHTLHGGKHFPFTKPAHR